MPDDATVRGYEMHARGWAAGPGYLGEAGRMVLELAAALRAAREMSRGLAERIAAQAEILALRASGDRGVS